MNSFHDRIYSAAAVVASKVNVEESCPRTTGRQQYRGHPPFTSISEYFKLQITVPALDYLLSELQDRFSSRLSGMLTQIMTLLPPSIAKRSTVLASSELEERLSFYSEHLPSPASLEAKLHCWTMKWQSEPEKAKELDSPLKTITSTDQVFFPNVKSLLQIACSLSVTSAECERSVSRLRYLKTYLRSTVSEERLNGLAMLYIHRDIPCLAETVVEQFAPMHPRRLELVDIFSE